MVAPYRRRRFLTSSEQGVSTMCAMLPPRSRPRRGAAALVGRRAGPLARDDAAKPTVLVAKVGKNDGYAMTLTKKGVDLAYGTTKHGPYTIYVHDYSDIHNFRIKGPGDQQVDDRAEIVAPRCGRSTCARASTP